MSREEDTFGKISDYINAEFSASTKDYEFLTRLNRTAASCFKDYQMVAEKIAKNVNRINENQKARQRLETLVKAIDDIDAKVTALEGLAYLIEEARQRGRREGPDPSEARLEVLAVEELHRQEERLVLGAVIEHLDDVRAPYPGGGPLGIGGPAPLEFGDGYAPYGGG